MRHFIRITLLLLVSLQCYSQSMRKNAAYERYIGRYAEITKDISDGMPRLLLSR